MNPLWITVLRRTLLALGGGLVAGGALDAGDLEAGVNAVITIVGAVMTLWSIYAEARARRTRRQEKGHGEDTE